MPRQSVRALVRAYYAIAGLAAGALAVGGIWNGISAAAEGCTVVFSQSDLAEPPGPGPIPNDFPSCQQVVDLLPILLGLATALVLLAAALRLSRTDALSRVVVGIGALLGIGFSGIPMWLVWWVSDYYNGSAPDAIGYAIGAPPLLIGLGAAWVTWRIQRHPQLAAGPAAA